MLVDPMGPWNGMLARVAGKIFTVWTVKRWGDPLTAPNSFNTGQTWTFKNYLLGLAAGYFGGELAARMTSKETGANFYQASSAAPLTRSTPLAPGTIRRSARPRSSSSWLKVVTAISSTTATATACS